MDEEQQDNLKDILGFDPSETSSTSGNSESGKRDKTPIEKAAIAMGVSVDEARKAFQESSWARLSNHVDVNNMFGIRKSFDSTSRCYYRYNLGKTRFDSFGTSAELQLEGQESHLHARVEYYGEGEERENLNFRKDNSLNVYKWIDKDRIVNIDYDSSGKFKQANFGIYAGDRNFGVRLNKETQNYQTWISAEDPLFDAGIYGSQERRKVTVPAIEHSETGEHVEIKLMRGKGETLTVPKQIDIQGVFHEMFPQDLLRNPTDPNTNLDNGWREDTPFHRLGIEWSIENAGGPQEAAPSEE